MAFVWVNSSAINAPITKDVMNEIKTNVGGLYTTISTKKPVASCGALAAMPTVTKGDTIIDTGIDAIEYNLDWLKANNWCRGYQVNVCTTNHATYYVNDDATKHTTYDATRHATKQDSYRESVNTDLCPTYHSTRNGTVYVNNHTTYQNNLYNNCATYHAANVASGK